MAASYQIRRLDEEGAPIAAEAGFQLACKRAETVARQVIVVTDVKRRARIGRPAKQKLPAQL